jgi:hypothetical protein
MGQKLSSISNKNIKHVLNNCVSFRNEKIVILYDTQCELSTILKHSYEKATNSTAVDFFGKQKEEVIEMFQELNEADLVVLIQSQMFRLDDYRIRLRLFDRGIKNIEHVHLGNIPKEQYSQYLKSLSFDPFGENDGKLGRRIKEIVDRSNSATVKCNGGTILEYKTPMEEVKLNIGDYEGMTNVGGTFPVGEVFTEPKDLNGVNGKLMIWGYPDLSRVVQVVEKPFELTIEKGLLVDTKNAPASFIELIDVIREGEGDIVMREFGLGLNKELNRINRLTDVTAFERQRGMHISLGKKHTVFAKEGISKRKTKFHIDLFVDVNEILMDDVTIWKNNDYVTKE